MKTCHAARNDRSGAVVVEFAITAPVLLLFCFAGIEFSRANMLIHTAEIAAVAGARAGIVAGATSDDCYNAVQEELLAVGVNEATVVVNPTTITDETGMVTVGVQIPLDARNGYVTPRFFLGKSIVRTVSITREAKDMAGSSEKAKQLNSQATNDLQTGGGKSAGKKGKDGGKAKGSKKGK